MKLLVKNLAIVIAVGVGLMLPAVALAVPAMPHQFYGTVSFSTGTTPDGLKVEAKIDNVIVGSVMTSGGKYGYSPLFKVEDNNGALSGKTIKFFVSGIDTGITAIFENGESTNLPLTVPGTVGTITKTADDVISNQSIIITSVTPTVIKMGDSVQITVSSQSNTSANIETVQKLSTTSYTGGMAVMSGKTVLNGYEIKITDGSGISISVVMKYDATGIDESTVKPYLFNGTSWVEITPFTRDTVNKTITFSVSSVQTPYVVFGQPLASTSSGGSTTSSSGSSGGGGGGVAVSTITNTPVTLSAAAQKVDANKDNKIDVLDFNTLMVNWGKTTANNVADFNSDGKVDIFDFNALMINWTK